MQRFITKTKKTNITAEHILLFFFHCLITNRLFFSFCQIVRSGERKCGVMICWLCRRLKSINVSLLQWQAGDSQKYAYVVNLEDITDYLLRVGNGGKCNMMVKKRG